MIYVHPILYKYMVRDGNKSKIVDSAPPEIMELAKETDERYYKSHLSHMLSNFDNTTEENDC